MAEQLPVKWQSEERISPVLIFVCVCRGVCFPFYGSRGSRSCRRQRRRAAGGIGPYGKTAGCRQGHFSLRTSLHHRRQACRQRLLSLSAWFPIRAGTELHSLISCEDGNEFPSRITHCAGPPTSQAPRLIDENLSLSSPPGVPAVIAVVVAWLDPVDGDEACFHSSRLKQLFPQVRGFRAGFLWI